MFGRFCVRCFRCHFYECQIAECHFAECQFAEYYFAYSCHFAKCHFANCQIAEFCCFAECQFVFPIACGYSAYKSRCWWLVILQGRTIAMHAGPSLSGLSAPLTQFNSFTNTNSHPNSTTLTLTITQTKNLSNPKFFQSITILLPSLTYFAHPNFILILDLHNDVIGPLMRHFSMENHYKLSQTNLQCVNQTSKLFS